jgi:hypothetical protein
MKGRQFFVQTHLRTFRPLFVIQLQQMTRAPRPNW